ncbi:hypothetical protein [Pseudobacteriovorax antillogorgiicola]|uniref:Carboxypeptidase regulatory-like domain-containing protein n=1 Tax=Pseudobacteriovorax antillogorgiicola TaxID=1513793 RepID=A0A1Y6CR61_9BACT|nr:hypothetical protein [Pseudobacteriovorax antillogorgiicola]TCS46722.1 hypothetical protein EDD56_12398 [Pseudobacteriovorax antillogorgiicola]SMF67120.1 hypothetical protein SAMN06296036_12398 [Pseudobacteriovorax antillogorgiicola]
MKFLITIGFTLILSSCRTTISGYVVSPEGKPIKAERGKVNVSRLDQKGFSEIVDFGSDGFFETQEEIQPGQYLIEPLIPGYQSNSLTVDITEDRQVEIQAVALPPKRSKAIEAYNGITVDQGSGGAIINPPRL